ncbi:UNVERIFIED_CONTAM: hypothetical protein Sradi_0196400 [Sesamum radiatum]|uniref:Reverse transcriptase Ty1/copia-type domain-containing protein n=1 Tax=Sesamum radiatum TaxID=300843 RepID=A0AAW2W174_SESRA
MTFSKSRTIYINYLLLKIRGQLSISSQGLVVTQNKYIQDIVKDVGLQQCKAVTTPLPAGLKFTFDLEAAFLDPFTYRRLIRILYLSITKPDTAHGAQKLSQFLQSPYKQHCS